MIQDKSYWQKYSLLSSPPWNYLYLLQQRSSIAFLVTNKSERIADRWWCCRRRPRRKELHPPWLWRSDRWEVGHFRKLFLINAHSICFHSSCDARGSWLLWLLLIKTLVESSPTGTYVPFCTACKENREIVISDFRFQGLTICDND